MIQLSIPGVENMIAGRNNRNFLELFFHLNFWMARKETMRSICQLYAHKFSALLISDHLDDLFMQLFWLMQQTQTLIGNGNHLTSINEIIDINQD